MLNNQIDCYAWIQTIICNCSIIPIFFANAQTRKITGKITSSEDGTPLSGVSITIKGTRAGTTSDAKGEFSMNVNPGTNLVLSYIGFEDKEVPVGNNNLALQLTPSNSKLNTVVVIGYGTQKKKNKPPQ